MSQEKRNGDPVEAEDPGMDEGEPKVLALARFQKLSETRLAEMKILFEDLIEKMRPMLVSRVEPPATYTGEVFMMVSAAVAYLMDQPEGEHAVMTLGGLIMEHELLTSIRKTHEKGSPTNVDRFLSTPPPPGTTIH